MTKSSPAASTGADAVPDGTSLAPTECVKQLLDATRGSESPDPYLERLASYRDDDLAVLRTDRDAALAFWTNLYNAGTQLLLSQRPDLYESSLRFFRFFGTNCVTVAGTGLSLDDIEQGILRGSRTKYGLGYLPRLLPDTFEVRYSLDQPDERIHFALNCGAASCPAIRFYEAGRIDDQLDRATRAYLDGTVEYDESSETVRLPRVFLWYRGDFGGGSGIRQLLREYGVISEDASPSLRHQSWDWSRADGKFAD